MAKAIGAVIAGKPDNWVIGFLFALLLIYPFCVLGATAGETLRARRRKVEREPIAAR